MDKGGDKKKMSFWTWFDRIQGDKVVWVVVICLIAISMVAIFSATSKMPEVVMGKKDRIDMFFEQLIGVGIGVFFLFICYKIPSIKTYRVLSQFGFAASAFLLFLAFTHTSIPHVLEIDARNTAVRSLRVFGKIPLNISEVVKVSMVLYLAWAVHAWKNGSFRIANKLSSREGGHFSFLAKPFWQGVVYILLPIITVCGLSIPNGTSSMLFTCAVMFATILIGGFSIRDVIIYCLVGGVVFFAGFSLYKVSDGKVLDSVFHRFDNTGGSRMDYWRNSSDDLVLANLEKARSEGNYQRVKDAYDQIVGPRIAIRNGRRFNGPGNSTQKYYVPLMFSDFMFSFLIEEYSIFMAAFLLVLYLSVLARGSRIAVHCNNLYARTAVGGLSVLISGQALMHMLINVGIFPVTGQTLPMISDGKSSLVMFSIAFGILLSISKMVKEKLDREAEEQRRQPGMMMEEDVRHSLDELDNFDSDAQVMDEYDEYYDNNEEEQQ